MTKLDQVERHIKEAKDRQKDHLHREVVKSALVAGKLLVEAAVETEGVTPELLNYFLKIIDLLSISKIKLAYQFADDFFNCLDQKYPRKKTDNPYYEKMMLDFVAMGDLEAKKGSYYQAIYNYLIAAKLCRDAKLPMKSSIDNFVLNLIAKVSTQSYQLKTLLKPLQYAPVAEHFKDALKRMGIDCKTKFKFFKAEAINPVIPPPAVLNKRP